MPRTPSNQPERSSWVSMPVQPVDRLADVLQHRDRPGGGPRRCGCRSRRRAARGCRRPARPRRGRAPGSRAGRGGQRGAGRRLEQQRAQVLAGLVVPGAEAGHAPGRAPWTARAGRANAWCRAVTSEKPTSTFGPAAASDVPVEQVDHPLDAVPAARAEHRRAPAGRTTPASGRRRGRRRRRRGSRTARAPPRTWSASTHVEAPGREHREPGVEPVGRDRPGRGDHRDPVAGRQPAAPGSASGRASSAPASRPCAGAAPRPCSRAISSRLRDRQRPRRRPPTSYRSAGMS